MAKKQKVTLPKAAIKRLIKSAGADRVSDSAADAFNKKALELATRAAKIAKANKRTTVQDKDVAHL